MFVQILWFIYIITGELDQDLTEESSEDSDSVVEEHSEDEIDVEVANFINPAKKSPPNGVISHHHRKKLSSLSKAGILLNKQLKKNNVKMHINSTSNGIIHDFVMEDIEFINQAAKLLDDFEKVNEEAYLPVIKIFFDWLKMNPDILKMSGKVLFFYSSVPSGLANIHIAGCEQKSRKLFHCF